MVVAGYGEVADTTKGIIAELPSPTFLANDLVTIEETTRLRRQRKGRPAEHVAFSGATTPRSITRYSAQITFDEMDAVDSGTTTGAFLMSFTELGRAARRCYLDLVWSKFLQNPACYDGTAMVHANHANSITTALGSAGLNNAMTKLLGQSFLADNGSVNQLGLAGRYLVVPAALNEKAREVARLYQLDGDANNLIVVPENRLGANGTTDPETSTVITSSDTCWALFAPAAQRPAVVVSYLEGSNTSPKIDSYTLDKGQWGMGWAVRLDIGVAFVDWRSIVFSSGAG